jgi:hypothetical protein
MELVCLHSRKDSDYLRVGRRTVCLLLPRFLLSVTKAGSTWENESSECIKYLVLESWKYACCCCEMNFFLLLS